MTDIPYNPSAWRSDGRLHPSRNDSEVAVGRAHVRRFRSVAHSVLFGGNGAIQILTVPPPPTAWTDGVVLFDKPGRDGKRILDL